MWYNETANTLKFQILIQLQLVHGELVEVMNTARYTLAGAGTVQTAGLAFGGYYAPPDTYYGNTESYNGFKLD